MRNSNEMTKKEFLVFLLFIIVTCALVFGSMYIANNLI